MKYKHIFVNISQEDYDKLKENNEIDEDTLYFTGKDEKETNTNNNDNKK